MYAPGPLVARVYLRLLALVSLCAWLSMAGQILVLIGAHGLLPIAPLLDEARRQHASFFELPTLFWLSASDGALLGATCLGAAASLYGVMRPGRVWIALSLPLYLSVCIAAQDFCGFQWDNLLLETSFLALFLDVNAPTRAAMWLPRLLLVKLYLESGIAKLGSPLGDWISGSAMTVYFETAPLPAPLARMFHSFPPGLLHASAWGVLVVELLVPLFVFGPRRLKRVAFVLLGAFQLVNLFTANYGFFVPLSLVLQVWLLDDETLQRLRLRAPEARSPMRRARIATTGVLVIWTLLSVLDGHLHLGGESKGAFMARIDRLTISMRERYAPFRVIGTYHLFTYVTTERIEPIIEVRTDDTTWTELVVRYKPGLLDRGLPFLAPHQPRVAFQLWFHGLAATGRAPRYLVRLEQLLCESPAAVASLFTTPPPPHALAVRIRYDRYTLTRPGEPNTWRREPHSVRPEWPCTDREEIGQR